MRILLDECVTNRLRQALKPDEFITVSEMGWSGIKNGKLLNKAVSEGFELLLTIDKNMEYQQNMSKYPITVVVFDVKRNKLEECLPLINLFFYSKLSAMKKGKVYKITSRS